MEGELFGPLNLIEKLVNWAGLGVAAIVSVGLKTASHKVSDIDSRLLLFESRISHIEANHITRDDLENILRDLKADLNRGFDRTHQRIDQLYSVSAGKNEHG